MTTLKDIAKESGVSFITVSRVINSPNKVKKETRDRVKDAMKKLNYSPNPAAKALVTNRTGIIDVFIPNSIELSHPFAMHFIAGISEVLSNKMYSFLIRRDHEVEHRCDGYIATGLLNSEINEMYKYAKDRDRPIALFGQSDLEDIDSVDVDNVFGAELATNNLINHGHRNIAMINVDNSENASDRLKGYKKALENSGIIYNEKIVVSSPNSAESGYKAMKKLLFDDSISSVFCATDTIALGAIDAILEAGKSVPNEFSVAGFDGLGHHLLSTPHITTIHQPVFEVGKLLASIIVSRIEEKTSPVKKIIKPTLDVNGSVNKIND